MRQYRLRIDPLGSDDPFEIDVRVYKTPQALQRAARRYDGAESWTGTLGVCHRFEIYSSYDDYQVRKPLVSIIRLQEENLDAGIISHEAAHAALYIHELRFGDRTLTTDDEEFAWVIGEITGQIIECIYGEA